VGAQQAQPAPPAKARRVSFAEADSDARPHSAAGVTDFRGAERRQVQADRRQQVAVAQRQADADSRRDHHSVGDATDGAATANTNGSFVHWNARSDACLRAAVEEAVGRPDWGAVATRLRARGRRHATPANCAKRWLNKLQPAGWTTPSATQDPTEPLAFQPTAGEVARSACLINNLVAARPETLRTSLRPVTNRPSERPRRETRRARLTREWAVAGGNPGAPFDEISRASYGIPAGEWPKPGRPETCFRPLHFTMDNGGDWVRRKLRRAGAESQLWSAERIWAEVQEWVATTRDDLRRSLSSTLGTHRARSAVFIIPAAAIIGHGPGESGEVVWSLAEYWAVAGGDATAEILPVDVDAAVQTRLNAPRLRQRLARAGVTDGDALCQLTESGMHTGSTCTKDMILHPNYDGVAQHAEVCLNLAQSEAVEGILSAPCEGVHCIPERIHPRSVVEPKLRVVADMTAPRKAKDGGGANSVNAGCDVNDPTLHDPLDLTSPTEFATDIGILQALADSAGLHVWVGKSDYSRYYRQLLQSLADGWHQALFIDPDGPQVDNCVTFGGTTACHGGNESADLLLRAVEDEFESTIAALEREWSRDQLEQLRKALPPGRPVANMTCADWEVVSDQLTDRGLAVSPQAARFAAETEVAHSGTAPRDITAEEKAAMTVLPRVRAVMRERAKALAAEHPELTEAEIGYQCRCYGLQAFFDDSLFGTFAELMDALVRAILRVAADIDLEIATHKMHVGTDSGQTGPLDADALTRLDHIQWLLSHGNMEALGKELDMVRRTLRDSDKRIDELERRVNELCSAGERDTRGGSERVPRPLIESTLGLGFYVVLTTPHARAGLNFAVRALRAYEQYRMVDGSRPHWAPWTQEATDGLRELVTLSRTGGGVAFNAMPATPGIHGRRLVYVIEDAAGCRTEERGKDTVQLPMEQQAGRGGFFLEPRRADGPAGPQLHWRYEKWTEPELRHNSTVLEGLNSTENLAIILEGSLRDSVGDAGRGVDIVECLDSQAFVMIGRKMRSARDDISELLARRGDLLRRHPDTRVFLLHFLRDKIDGADGVSKADVAEDPTTTGFTRANAWLEARALPPITAVNRRR
jgi:hypothetical protein